MTQHDPIKYRADGSIDIDHYTRRGRRMRSEQAMRMMSRGEPQTRKPRRRRFGFLGVI
jgi:hypothetical protein